MAKPITKSKPVAKRATTRKPGKSLTPRVNETSIRRFDGAKVTRLTTDWIGNNNSLDTDLQIDLRRLIDRSRNLEQNNEYAEGFLKLAENNVLGSNPFVLQMKILEGPGQHDLLAENGIEDAWRVWGKPRNCTTSGSMSLKDVYRVGLRAILRDGATLLRIHRGSSFGKFGFQLEPMDIDYLDEMDNRDMPGGNRIIMGVEVDNRRRPVAYHLWGNHPGEMYWTAKRQKTRVPARDIIHPFVQNRANQTRGYPIFAATMMGIRMLGGYKENELVAARVAAGKMGFFEKTPGEAGGYTGPNAEQGGKYMDVEPGSMEELPAGLTFKGFDPQHPTSQYGDFVRECLRGFAAALGVSYTSLANDLSQVNYSSGRMGMLGEQESWKMMQSFLIEHICEPVFEEWLFAALAAGAITIPTGQRLPLAKYDKFHHPYFQGRRWKWVDPLKEALGAEKALALGLTSPQRVTAESGLDSDEILDELEMLQAIRRRLGILPRQQEANLLEQQALIESANEE